MDNFRHLVALPKRVSVVSSRALADGDVVGYRAFGI